MSEIPSWVATLVIHILFSKLGKYPRGVELAISHSDEHFSIHRLYGEIVLYFHGDRVLMHRLFVVLAILHSDEEPEYQYQSEAYICFLQASIEELDILSVEFHLVNLILGVGLGILSWDVLFFRRIFLSAVGECRSMEVFSHHGNVLQIPLGVRVLMGTCCYWGENLRIHHACLVREFLEDCDPGEEMGDLR